MRIAIIGGGATGALAALHLARGAGRRHEIVLVEPAAEPGRGVAYSTTDRGHLLNVRAGNMSAFPDDPDHFHRWLQAHGAAEGVGRPTAFSFVPRAVYGRYLADLVDEAVTAGTVAVERARCDDLTETQTGVAIALDSGRVLTADLAVLATGNESKPKPVGQPTVSPWTPGAFEGLDPAAPVLIVGTGLTMIDTVTTLVGRGHTGPITALSRRGLLPTPHRTAEAMTLEADAIPFGAPVSRLTAWLRGLARARIRACGDWRSAVDALRPHTSRLWQAMDEDARRRFLRHARSWWDTHRHRMAPDIAATIEALKAEGRLELVAGRVLTARVADTGVAVTFRARGCAVEETRVFARAFDCTGLSDDPARSSNPLIQRLLARGTIRPDALGIGLDIGDDLAVVGRDGQTSRRLFAMGPLGRAAFWECIAVPDIRIQCADFAARLAARPQPLPGARRAG